MIVGQYRAPLDCDTWELPAGRVDEGESAEAAARRECEEEIGRVPHQLERIRGLYPAPGFCDELLIFFAPRTCGRRRPTRRMRPTRDEDIRVRRVTIAEARAMVEGGEIVDLKTAYALTLI